MAKQSFIKRILSLGRVEEGLEGEGTEPAMSSGSGLDTSASGEAALRPSITEVLFRRRTAGDADRTEEPSDSRALVTEQTAEKKLTRKEETAQKISEGFDNLSGLLKSINSKLDTDDERGRMIAESIEDLPEVLRSIPETNRAQIEFLGTISKQLDLSNARSGEMMEQFRSLPEILKSLPAAQRENAERLQEITSLLSESSGKQIEWMKNSHQSHQVALHAFQNAQNKSLNLFHKAQQNSLNIARNAQTEQSRQLQDFIDGTQRSMNRVMVACAVIVGVAVVAVGAMFLFH